MESGDPTEKVVKSRKWEQKMNAALALQKSKTQKERRSSLHTRIRNFYRQLHNSLIKTRFTRIISQLYFHINLFWNHCKPYPENQTQSLCIWKCSGWLDKRRYPVLAWRRVLYTLFYDFSVEGVGSLNAEESLQFSQRKVNNFCPLKLFSTHNFELKLPCTPQKNENTIPMPS